MRYSQLRAFHAVAAHGGFSRAAERLALSQPAISDHVRKLEEAHGVELFLRRHGAVTLTELGRRLFAITERLFEAESEAHQLLARSGKLDEGTLTIGADAAVHFLPILARFRERHPKVSVKLVSGNSAQLLDRLDNFEIDLAVTAANPVSVQYASWLLREDRLAAFVASSHPLAPRKTLPLADLVKWPVILREQGSVTRTLLLDELGRRRLPLASAIEIETREATKDAVAQGLGIGIISRGEFASDGRVRLLEFADWTAMMSEWLICLKARADLHVMRAMIGMIDEKKRPRSVGP